MNQNLLELNNGYGKRNFIRSILRCLFILCLCSIVFYPVVTNATEHGGSGGSFGSVERSGGLAKAYATRRYDILLSVGHAVGLSDGNLSVKEEYNSGLNSAIIPIDSISTTMIAASKSISNITLEFDDEYRVVFHHWDGAKFTCLGVTPKFKGVVNLEVPRHTTRIVIESYTLQEGFYTFTRLLAEDEEEPARDATQSIFTKFDNQWQVGLKRPSPDYKAQLNYSENNKSMWCSTVHMYDTQIEHKITLAGWDSAISHFVYIHYYDSQFNYIISKKITVDGTPKEFENTVANSRYMHIEYYHSGSYTVNDWYYIIKITGLLNDNVTGNSYAIDNTSISTIVNSNTASTINYNITAGDNSNIVFIDGDGNTVTLPGTSPIILEPGDGVSLTDEETEDDDGGLFDGIIDLLKGIFDGLGDILTGIMEILLIPINFIVDTIADTLELLKGVLQSLLGLSEFFGQLFFFLPSPIPEMLILFIPAILVVAIVKMFL